MIKLNKFLFITVQQLHFLNIKPHYARFWSFRTARKSRLPPRVSWLLEIPHPGLTRPPDHSDIKNIGGSSMQQLKTISLFSFLWNVMNPLGEPMSEDQRENKMTPTCLRVSARLIPHWSVIPIIIHQMPLQLALGCWEYSRESTAVAPVFLELSYLLVWEEY